MDVQLLLQLLDLDGDGCLGITQLLGCLGNSLAAPTWIKAGLISRSSILCASFAHLYKKILNADIIKTLEFYKPYGSWYINTNQKVIQMYSNFPDNQLK